MSGAAGSRWRATDQPQPAELEPRGFPLTIDAYVSAEQREPVGIVCLIMIGHASEPSGEIAGVATSIRRPLLQPDN